MVSERRLRCPQQPASCQEAQSVTKQSREHDESGVGEFFGLGRIEGENTRGGEGGLRNEVEVGNNVLSASPSHRRLSLVILRS